MAETQIRQIDLSPEALLALNAQKTVRSNTVRTSKYRWYTFLPLNLFEQFTKKLANMYFLLIMFMQMITVISISNGQPAMAPPLFCVVLISMIKDAYEDYKRHQEDGGENNALAKVYSSDAQAFIDVAWKDIKVGDIVHINKDKNLPSKLENYKTTNEHEN